jgi:hypothetical protein
MGTFAKTAIVSHRLSFADQGKQTSAFRLSLQQTNGSLPFLLSVCNKQTEIVSHTQLSITTSQYQEKHTQK